MSSSVAVVSAVDPYPCDAGKKVVLAGILEYLIDRYGTENVHYVMVGGVGLRRFPTRLHPIAKPRPIAAIGNVLTRTGTGRASLQEALLRTGEIQRDIHRVLDRLAPSVEIYDTVRMAQHARHRAATKQVCYLDDLFSERYGAILAASERFPDLKVRPLGNFATHVPRAVRPLADHQFSQRQLLRLEQRLVCRSEDRAAHRFDTTLLINAQEAARLSRRCNATPGRVDAIPPLLPHQSVSRRAYRGRPVFVFVGQLSLPHNDYGLRSFLGRVWPRVLAGCPEARLRIVGRHPLPELSDLVARHCDSVTLEGFVPDLGDVFDDAAALINPLQFGSGVKLKVIEALSAGLPVVSTSIGADGIASGPDEGVLVSDDDAETAEVLMATTNTHLNAVLTAAALEHFAIHYSRRAVFDRYDAVFSPNRVRARTSAEPALTTEPRRLNAVP